MTPARLARAAGVGLVVALVTLTVTYGLLFQRSLPTIDGNYRLLGLEERVEVARDAYGIPHITAATRRDMFFMQGYVTAQDRLAQMEILRRAAREKIPDAAELAGRSSPAARAALDAYAAGVSKLIAQYTGAGALPGEIVLAGIRPTPWLPEDSVAIAGAYLGRSVSGSKCFVAVATLKGRPILGADVFADVAGPGLYEVGLEAGGTRAIGASLAGVPGLIGGTNAWTAWALQPDGADAVTVLDALVRALDARTAGAFRFVSANGLMGCAADLAGGASAHLDVPSRVDVELMRAMLGKPATGMGARLIVDLAEVDLSRSAVSSGASGHPRSPHFNDQAAIWEIGQVHRLALSRSAIGVTDGVLVFRPR
ncbi:MAG: penicillin acylase family protein [Chloroflexi bacterium]|nr:penicillin acylase family protein [Chloroflexota bacterium]